MIITDTHKAKAPEKKAAHEYRDEHTPDVTGIVLPMAQQLRVPISAHSLAADPSSVPRTHTGWLMTN